MKYINGKYIETKYCCKFCGNADMSANHVGEYVKGWRCNICEKVCYPIRDKIKTNNIHK